MPNSISAGAPFQRSSRSPSWILGRGGLILRAERGREGKGKGRDKEGWVKTVIKGREEDREKGKRKGEKKREEKESKRKMNGRGGKKVCSRNFQLF